MTFNDLVRELKKLLPQDRRMLREILEREQQNDTTASGSRTSLDHDDDGARLTNGTDAREYINRLHDEWHDRVKIHANSAR